MIVVKLTDYALKLDGQLDTVPLHGSLSTMLIIIAHIKEMLSTKKNLSYCFRKFQQHGHITPYEFRIPTACIADGNT
jgi:hypothetical protein